MNGASTLIAAERAKEIALASGITDFKIFDALDFNGFGECVKKETRSGSVANFFSQNGNMEMSPQEGSCFVWVKSVNDKVPIGTLFYSLGLYKHWEIAFNFSMDEISSYYGLSQIDGPIFFSLQHAKAGIFGQFIANCTSPDLSTIAEDELLREKAFPMEDSDAYNELKELGLKLLKQLNYKCSGALHEHDYEDFYTLVIKEIEEAYEWM